MRLTMAALRLLILTLILYALFTLRSVGLSLTQARQQLELQRTAVTSLREENARLRQRINEESEKEKWEYIARRQLGLVSPDEIVTYNVGD